MPSYIRLKIFIFLFIFAQLLNASPAKEVNSIQNDFLILMAVDYENNKQFEQSAVVFEELYNNTKEYSYLQRSIENYSRAKRYRKISTLSYDNFDVHISHKEFLQQQYILANVVLEKNELALKVAKDLINTYPSFKNYFIVADLYFVIGSYRHAKKYYKKAYDLEANPKILSALVDIMYNYLDQKNEAKELLEIYQEKNGCDIDICSRLIRYYQDSQEIDKMVTILDIVYQKYKDSFNEEKLKRVQTFMVETYQSIDIQKAIEFLEETGANFDKLLSLYGLTKQYSKALELVQNKYNETKEKTLLGQIAILEFELADDKREVINSVLEKFEVALNEKENANFENYYGYILIDYDINPKKGLTLVKKALKKQPTNLAYMDSVAWGLFKTNECEEAYKYMKAVVDEVGLENEEIKFHYNEIRECINDFR